MKRNKEQKFRIKLIQEFHLNKVQQKQLDHFVNKTNINYEFLYFHKNTPKCIDFYCRLKSMFNIPKDQMQLAFLTNYNKIRTSFKNALNETGGNNNA